MRPATAPGIRANPRDDHEHSPCGSIEAATGLQHCDTGSMGCKEQVQLAPTVAMALAAVDTASLGAYSAGMPGTPV